MKRRLPDETRAKPPPRRRRVLSEEEQQLWDSVARQARPLHKRVTVGEADVMEAAASPSLSVTNSRPHAPKKVKPAKVASKPVPPLAPLARRERLQLSRGKTEIDAWLDLHGMTQARAHRALLQFLQRASGDGLRFVLVITGKGRTTGPESQRGILRRQVPEWLSLPEFRAFVVGFEEAHVGHGGGGALYVRVRRHR